MKYFLFLTILIFSKNSLLKTNEINLKTICENIKKDLVDLEIQKINLKNEFKKFKNEIEQMELLPELTEDVNKTLKQQIQKAKLFHYLDCNK